MDLDDISQLLLEGKIGVYPTDTIYGILGSAFLPDTIEKIFDVKKRSYEKPLVVLISEINDVEKFGVILDNNLIEQLSSYWPGPISIILPTIDEQFAYLTREGATIAFRLPSKESLRDLIRTTGPLVAPSANPEGLPHARSIKDAQKYFGDDVDFYVDEGELEGDPSTLIDFSDGLPRKLR